MFIHASTHITYFKTMRLLADRLLVSLLCIRVVCENPPPSGVGTSSATDVFPQHMDRLIMDGNSTAAEATFIGAEVVDTAFTASSGLAETPTLSTQLSLINGRTPQSSAVSDGSVPLATLITTPLVTLNGNGSHKEIAVLPGNHPYLTKSPLTTQPSESIDALPEETDQTVIRDPMPFINTTNDKSFVDRLAERTIMPLHENVTKNYSGSDTSFTTINSQSSTASSGSFGTSPTVSYESVDALETKTSESVTRQVTSTAYSKYLSSKDVSTDSMSFTIGDLYSPPLTSGIETTEDAMARMETVNQDTTTADSEAAIRQSQAESNLQKTARTYSSSTELDKTTSTSTPKASEGRSSSAITSTDMLPEDYMKETSFDSEDLIQSTTTEDACVATDQLRSEHSSTQEGTNSTPSDLTDGLESMDKDHIVNSMNTDLTKMTASTGDYMQSTTDVLNDRKSVKYTSTTKSRRESVITTVVKLDSTQSLTALQNHLKSTSSYNPTTLPTTQFEEASSSPLVKDETGKSTNKSPYSRPSIDVSSDLSEDLSTITEFSTTESNNLDLSGTTEALGDEINQAKFSTTTTTKVIEEVGFTAPLDPIHESKRAQKILPTDYPPTMQKADGEGTKAKKFTDPPQLPINPNPPPPQGTGPEGMTVATAISMGLIFIFLLILFCILAVSLIAGWVHCRGRESRRPKVSLIRVERGLATEFANSWNKGRSSQAWMTTRSGTTMISHTSGAQLPQSISYSPPPSLPPQPSFQCGCKRRNLFGNANRLCMVHGDPSAKHNASAVRAVKIISLTDESDDGEVGTVLLTDLGRRRASGASNAPDEENVDSEGRSGGRRLSEWLYIDES